MEHTPLEISFNPLQILMSSFDTWFDVQSCTECHNMVTEENSYNLIAIMKRYPSKFLLWERRSHSISYVGTPFPCVPAPLHHCNHSIYRDYLHCTVTASVHIMP